MEELKQYRNDPRVLNLEGVIEYRRHRRHAAEQAFREAAQMGDEQAAVNLQIVENNKKR
jgi:Flp pilus assembly protein TadD